MEYITKYIVMVVVAAILETVSGQDTCRFPKNSQEYIEETRTVLAYVNSKVEELMEKGK